jgi:hypothetical protein
MLDKGKEVEAREDRVGEEIGEEFNELGMEKSRAKIEVG